MLINRRTTEAEEFSFLINNIQALLLGTDDIYLVGGFVRDLFLNKPSKDIDLLLIKNTKEAAKTYADLIGGAFVTLDSEHHAYRVVYNKMYSIDFVKSRATSVEADLCLRDFSINAMAIKVSDYISNYNNLLINWSDFVIDPTGGIADLQDLKLRHVYVNAFVDDPLRVLRGIRLAAKYNLNFAKATIALMETTVQRLLSISPERIRDELWQLIELDSELFISCRRNYYITTKKILDTSSSLKKHYQESIVSGRTKKQLLLVVAWLHDMGVDDVIKSLKKLKLSKKEITCAKAWLANYNNIHELYEQSSDEAIGYYVWADIKAEKIEPNKLLEKILEWQSYYQKRKELIPLFEAKDLIAHYGLQAEQIAAMLKLLSRAQVESIINNKKEADIYISSLIKEQKIWNKQLKN